VGRDFPHPSQLGTGVHTASCTTGAVLLPGIKRPRRGVSHPPTSSTEVKERVQLYIYSPAVPSWHIIETTLLLLYLFKVLKVTCEPRKRGATLHRIFRHYLSLYVNTGMKSQTKSRMLILAFPVIHSLLNHIQCYTNPGIDTLTKQIAII
jgi:hypothetical protein